MPGESLSSCGTSLFSWVISSRISGLTYCETSKPQTGQMTRAGESAMSGVTSKANLAPHAHWTFIAPLVTFLFYHRLNPESIAQTSRRQGFVKVHPGKDSSRLRLTKLD